MVLPSRVDRPSSSLLDRLAGDDGEVSSARFFDNVPIDTKMTRQQHVANMLIVREQIRRDLLMLLSTKRAADDEHFERWSEISTSVLNYGVPDIAGMTASSIQSTQLQNELVEVIRRFEPRLHADSIEVTCVVNGPLTNDVTVEVNGLFGPQDALEEFTMTVSISLNGGSLDGAA